MDWLPVPSWPGYFANELGQIRGRRGWILTPQPQDGYLVVKPCRDGKAYLRRVHVMVCEAFHGPKPTPRHEAAHGDGDRANCRPGNLRWATHKENSADMFAHGTKPIGEKHWRSQLTNLEVDAIRKVYAENRASSGYIRRGARAQLAKDYGVSVEVIKSIGRGRRSAGPAVVRAAASQDNFSGKGASDPGPTPVRPRVLTHDALAGNGTQDTMRLPPSNHPRAGLKAHSWKGRT